MLLAKKLLISGRVQGVSFRMWTVMQANELGVSGWVRNLRTGDVEAFVQGEEEYVRKLIDRCRHGPALAQVDDLKVENAAYDENLKSFEQRATQQA